VMMGGVRTERYFNYCEVILVNKSSDGCQNMSWFGLFSRFPNQKGSSTTLLRHQVRNSSTGMPVELLVVEQRGLQLIATIVLQKCFPAATNKRIHEKFFPQESDVMRRVRLRQKKVVCRDRQNSKLALDVSPVCLTLPFSRVSRRKICPSSVYLADS
jgi:hypothetical protein